MKASIRIDSTATILIFLRTDKIIKVADKVKSLNCEFYFNISIDGLQKEHDKLRGVEGSFKKAIKTAKLLKQKEFNVCFATVINKDNMNFASYPPKGIRGKDFNLMMKGINQMKSHLENRMFLEHPELSKEIQEGLNIFYGK